MKKDKISLAGLLMCFFLGSSLSSLAQDDLNYPDFKGVKIEFSDPNSNTSTKIKFNARIQNRIDLSSYGNEGLSPTEILFRIRRLRLKSSGHLIDPRLTFKIELAFSRDDIDGQLGITNNIINDAYIQYAFTPSLGLRFGQFKAPGNRERVVSSGDLALVDRSILNSAYNLDRDIGVMLLYEKEFGQTVFNYYAMLSNGEGRNTLSTEIDLNDNNELDLAIIQRVEFLPLGAFEDGGDYFEADLLREETPKLSIGGGYSHNNDAVRSRGQRSGLLFETRNINTTFADMMFKYQGWSLMAEYIWVDTNNDPVTISEDFIGDQVAVRVGDGYMVQGGYVWPSMWGLTARYSSTTPGEGVYNTTYSEFSAETETRLGLSKYIRGHRIKVQSDIGYLTETDFGDSDYGYWVWRFQMELGF